MKEDKNSYTDLLAYLLGEMSQSASNMLEAELENDPDLRQQLNDLENDLEQMAMENAITPPTSIKAGLEVLMETEPGIPIFKTPSKSRNIVLPIAAGLAVLFGLTSVWLFTNLNNARDQVQQLSGKSQQLEERLNILETDYARTTRLYELINNSNVLPVILEGNDKIPGSRAIAYVNHKEKEVWINPKGLPDLDKDQTYQMWADVEGVMINMGVINNDEDLLAMTYIDEAESLNITIEPAGGSLHPTVENLVSNVYL